MLEDIDNLNKAYFDRLKPRDYICACGKAYLSYPALFTHIKQKHDGTVSIFLFSPLVKLQSPVESTQNEEDRLSKLKAILNNPHRQKNLPKPILITRRTHPEINNPSKKEPK